MIIGPRYKICRRLGDAVFSKCQTPRYAMTEGKKKADKMKKRKHRSNVTEYGTQLLEKQKLRYTYGISEKQLSNYVTKARRMSSDSPAVNTYKLLESRLDNVIFRMGLVPTRQFARQVVTHGHIMVNGKKLDIPSGQIKPGDKISIRPKSKENPIFKSKGEALKEFVSPTWMTFDPVTLEAGISGRPKMGEQESNLNFALVVQFYSRV